MFVSFIRRLCVLPFALLLACAASAGVSIAQNPGEQVVARITLKAPSNQEKPVFAEVGEMMTVVEKKERSVMVRTGTGRRGWVRAQDVVALPEAAAIYDGLIKKEPKDPWNYVSRAMVWNMRGEKEKEIADLNKAIELKIDSPSVWVNRGAARATAGKLEAAIDDYNEAIRRGFKDPSVYMNRAVAYLSKGEAEQAIEDFDRAIEQQPENIFALLQRGVAHQRLQAWDKAIADFSRVLELDGENLRALSSRGFTYYLKREPKKAIDDFTALIELNPKSALAFNNRGYNRQMICDFRGAAKDFTQAIELAPKYALAYQNKAWLLATCPEEDVRDGEAAIELARKAGELREWKALDDVKTLAAAYAETGDFQQAVEWQKKAIEMAQGDAKTTEQELLKLYQSDQPFRFTPPAP